MLRTSEAPLAKAADRSSAKALADKTTTGKLAIAIKKKTVMPQTRCPINSRLSPKRRRIGAKQAIGTEKAMDASAVADSPNIQLAAPTKAALAAMIIVPTQTWRKRLPNLA